MVRRPRTPCPVCGALMPANNMARHVATHRPAAERLAVPLDVQVEMVRLYNRPRSSTAQVAAATYWSKTEVRRVLIANGVTMRPQGHSQRRITVDEELERATLYGQGRSILEVAELVGRHHSAIAESLHRAGVKVRPKGRNLRHSRSAAGGAA